MGRRTSGQTTGLEKIGNIQASAATLSSSQTNQDITLDPNGTGVTNINSDIVITGDLTMANQGDLRLREATGNGTNYIAQQAAATMAANYTITWPAAVSTTAGFVLTSDASGVLSWASAGGNIPVTDAGSTATIHYPFFGTASGAVPTTLSPLVRSNLAFVPSTGELSSDIGRHANVIGSTANSGTITIRGTSSATKATASVLLTDGVASSTTATGSLVVTGGVGVSGQLTATTVVETSSIAFKENINPIENALDTVMKLLGVTYDRKDNKEHEAGLIAEDVYKIAPDLVSLDKDGNPYGIKYTKLGAYLIEAIKTIKEEIDQLKVR
jgi:hypothetical protein